MDAPNVGDHHVEDACPHYAGDCHECHDIDGVRVVHDRHSHRVHDRWVRDDPKCCPDVTLLSSLVLDELRDGLHVKLRLRSRVQLLSRSWSPGAMSTPSLVAARIVMMMMMISTLGAKKTPSARVKEVLICS